MIRIIIAGSRNFNDYALLEKALNKYIEDTKINPNEIEIVSGHARGAAQRSRGQTSRKVLPVCQLFSANDPGTDRAL